MDPSADRIARECIGVRVRALAREVTRLYDEALRPLDVTSGQLQLLVGVGKLEPAATAGKLSHALRIDASTLSRSLARLEERGWLKTRRAAEGRGQLLSLTASGRSLLRRAGRPWQRAQEGARVVLEQYGIDRLRHPLLDADDASARGVPDG